MHKLSDAAMILSVAKLKHALLTHAAQRRKERHENEPRTLNPEAVRRLESSPAGGSIVPAWSALHD
jgi:hypothetical protein